MKDNITSVFEKEYREWKSYCARPEIVEQSSDKAYINNAPFRAIVALGREAIPAVIRKLQEDPDAHFLIHALARITGKVFSAGEIDEAQKKWGTPLGNQGYAHLWIEWWETEQGRQADLPKS